MQLKNNFNMKKNNSLMRQFWVPASVVGYFLILFFCFDSLNSFCLLSLVPIVSIKSYSNAEADKDTILSENTNKSGIYMWKNFKNGKRYIGSSNNLKIRFSQYYNANHLESIILCISVVLYLNMVMITFL